MLPTPHLADHSAYDAYSLLVEARGRRLFYTGDIRGHGRKAKLFDQLVGNSLPPISPRARALLDTIDPSIPWHIQHVQRWQRHPEDASEVTSTRYGLHEVP